MTPSPVFTQSWVNEKRLTDEFYRSFLKMAGLHIFGILDESTEVTNSYTNFNDELRWLWNSVYEPVREKTNNLGSDQVRHRPGCTVPEDG